MITIHKVDNITCHMCGCSFAKASLPSHQKSCIRRTLSIRSTRSAPASAYPASVFPQPGSGGGHSDPISLYACASCHNQIPQHKLATHLRLCRGVKPASTTIRIPVSSQYDIDSSSIIPATHAGKDATSTMSTDMDFFNQNFQKELDIVRNENARSAKPMVYMPNVNTASRTEHEAFYGKHGSVSANADYSDTTHRSQTGGLSGEQVSRSTNRILPVRSAVPKRPESSVSRIGGPGSAFTKQHPSTVASIEWEGGHASKQGSIRKGQYDYEDDVFEEAVGVIEQKAGMEFEQTDIHRIPCDVCGRKFAADRLAKHASACSKATRPRKVFDMVKARSQGTELEKYTKKGTAKPTAAELEIERKLKAMKGNWRVKHENFISSMRGGRGNKGSSDMGGRVAVMEMPSDHVECHHCGRKFNEEAGKRHIPICGKNKEKQAFMSNRRPRTTGLAGGSGIYRSSAQLLSASIGGVGGMTTLTREELVRKRTSFKPPTPKVSVNKGHASPLRHH